LRSVVRDFVFVPDSLSRKSKDELGAAKWIFRVLSSNLLGLNEAL
jgi:hypothetical protein